jgi:uncharacterized protein YPO0396
MSIAPNKKRKTEYLENESELRPPLPGYRLSKLEIYNWGTFDGAVHSVHPDGKTTLLIGENGSGKSTVIDALLTLLVRPQTRNYNVAAGATKNERDERSYIRGAYDRTVSESGKPQIQYLRSSQGHYTTLLAVFHNQPKKSSFTVCQVLYLNSDNTVEKIYAFKESEGGIAEDLGGFTSGTAISKTLRERGYQTTGSYTQYLGWIQRQTGFRNKAMSVFNQTVAVKDVQRLDLFIQQHMLELKPWKERVSSLLEHFSELSEAHRMLLRVRQQDELLRPIADAGERYHEKSELLEETKRRLSAVGLYFANETCLLLEPLCEQWQMKLQLQNDDIKRLENLQSKLRKEIARLEIEIETAGGDRLREIPRQIEQQAAIASVKKDRRAHFESQLSTAGLKSKLTSPEQFAKLRKQLIQHRESLKEERKETRNTSQNVQYEIGALAAQLSEDRRELEALDKRKNNLPEALISLRDRMCRELKLAPSDLPFVAELIAINPEEQRWEASIEQVLYGFARSLLVPTNLYSRVAKYVENTRLEDSRGSGQRLVYLRVNPAESAQNRNASGAVSKHSLLHKLELCESHSLAGWVQAEIAARFNFEACETIEQFQKAKGAAMTVSRHFKSGSMKHEKDDRTSVGDRRYFVLGWDNRAKRSALMEVMRQTEESLSQLRSRSVALDVRVDEISASLEALEQALKIEAFELIDFERHEFEVAQLQLERAKLEGSNDQVRQLKSQRDQLAAEADGHNRDRDQYIADRSLLEKQLNDGKRLLSNADAQLQKARQSGVWQAAEAQFESIKENVKQKLSIENLAMLPNQVADQFREHCEKQAERLAPISRELISAMTRFLKKFPEEQADLDANIESLSSFEALFHRISGDDLPKHEERFKLRLNEKVLQEIGLLNSRLENDRQEIREKIDQLNEALRRLEWKSGTFMQLEPSDAPDREIQDFRRELAGCLNGTLNGSAEANEATFVKIERLVTKLRDEGNERWRQKVIDVRNWFNFAAREIVSETGESRSYYDGGTGQSGGEKGKLAFLVLVAAIAYQYDIDPDDPNSTKFHFVMVDEMFSRSDDQHAEYALDLFERFGLQILIVAPLDSKARVTEPYVGTYLHAVKDKVTHRSQLLQVSVDDITEA